MTPSPPRRRSSSPPSYPPSAYPTAYRCFSSLPARRYSRRSSSSASPMTMKVATDLEPRSITPPGSSPLVPSSKLSSHILHTPIDSPSTINSPYHAGPSGAHLRTSTVRRQSGFDPMKKDDEADYEQYGDLGDKHPLRRIEERTKQDGAEVSLPGVKALFGTMQDRLATSSSSQSLFYSSSLPSLRPGSPSSPSTSRTSRYPSIASASSNTGSFSTASGGSGWWAPDYDRPGSSSAGPSSARGSWTASSAHYRPTHLEPTRPYVDEHYDKRRRSDQPSPGKDPEESARLHWAAQNRNASYPTSAPVSSSVPMRSTLHPPPTSTMGFSRSVDTPPVPQFSSPLTPHDEMGEFPFDRRPNATRHGSIVGGQLAQSFADLSASERSPRREMPPPDFRGTPTTTTSVHSPPSDSLRPPTVVSPLTGPSTPHRPPTASPQPPMSAPPSRIHISESSDRLRRQSLARPQTPDSDRRSSLTELIRSKTGDDLAMAQGKYSHPALHSEPALPVISHGGLPAGIPLERPSLSDTSIILTGWHPTRSDRDVSTVSPAPSPMRNRKRSVAERTEHDMPLPSPGPYLRTSTGGHGQVYDRLDTPERDAMRGMDILAESARRISEAESRDISPSKTGPSGSSTPTAPRPMAGGAAPPSSGPKYQCDFCPKNFSRPSSLKIHRFSHTGERPFKCLEPSCGRSFSVQSNLKRHAKVHLLQPSPGGRVHPAYPSPQRAPIAGAYSSPADGYRPRSNSADETLSPLARRHSASGVEEEIDELEEDEEDLGEDEEDELAEDAEV